MIIFNLIISLLIGYEIHKLLKFKMFYKLRVILHDYNKEILVKKNSKVQKAIANIAVVDFFYLIVIIIGLFTINWIFCVGIILLAIIETFTFKNLKYKIIRKILFAIDITLSLILLSMIIVNSFFFEMDGLELVKQLLNK